MRERFVAMKVDNMISKTPLRMKKRRVLISDTFIIWKCKYFEDYLGNCDKHINVA